MKNILKDGNVENIDGRPKIGNVWYIPHQGVYHPRKPEKNQGSFRHILQVPGYCPKWLSPYETWSNKWTYWDTMLIP